MLHFQTLEIILSIITIQAGLFELVKANIVGSLLGQILLVLGWSLLVGKLRFRGQKFYRQNIVFHLSTLFMSLVVLSIPTILIMGNSELQDIENGSSPSSQDSMISVLSNSFAILLIAV